MRGAGFSVVLASDHAVRLEKIRRMEKQTGRQG